MTAPYVRTRGQVVEQLVAGRRIGWWRYRGQVSAGEYAVELDLPDGKPMERRHGVAGMSAYLDGHHVGASLPDRAISVRDDVIAPDEVRTLLNCPGVLDQRRIRVAHAMGVRGWTYADVAVQIHAQRSTVRDLLAYRRTPVRVTASSRKLAEVEALLPELKRGYGRKPGPLPGLARVQGLAEVDRKEPAELRRARALALTYEAGLLMSWAPLDVNLLRPARVVELVDVGHGDDEHVVRVSTLIAWLQGFADGAAQASEPWLDTDRAAVTALARALA